MSASFIPQIDPTPQLLVVPIYWGWPVPLPATAPFTVFDILKGIMAIVDSPFLDGLAEYGIAARGAYAYGAIVPAGYKVPNPFTSQQCWDMIDRALNEKWVDQPVAYDTEWPVLNRYRTVYTLFVAPGNYHDDPNIFGENSKTYRPGAAACWVTANSDLAGALGTFAHELVEGGSGHEIADDCANAGTFYLNGVRLPKYIVNGSCWPDEATLFRWLMEELLANSRYRGTTLASHLLRNKPVRAG